MCGGTRVQEPREGPRGGERWFRARSSLRLGRSDPPRALRLALEARLALGARLVLDASPRARRFAPGVSPPSMGPLALRANRRCSSGRRRPGGERVGGATSSAIYFARSARSSSSHLALDEPPVAQTIDARQHAELGTRERSAGRPRVTIVVFVQARERDLGRA